MTKEKITFTVKDLVAEAGLLILNEGDLRGGLEIIVMGIQYNKAKKGGDAEENAKAYRALHPELQKFKHNILGRGRNHW